MLCKHSCNHECLLLPANALLTHNWCYIITKRMKHQKRSNSLWKYVQKMQLLNMTYTYITYFLHLINVHSVYRFVCKHFCVSL